ncbi:hypothetical protein BsWGS_20909 [Bradybaena similaris]
MTTALVVLLACAVVALSSACCTPDQWEGMETAFGDYGSTIRPNSGIWMLPNQVISYDAKNNRSAFFTTSGREGQVVKFKSLIIYDNKSGVGKWYDMDYIRDECMSGIMDTPFPKICLPAEAKPGVNFSFGYAPVFNMVGYIIPGKIASTLIAVQELGNNQCMPVLIAPYAPNGTVWQDRVVETYAFINITYGIKNETVFDIPEKCKEMSQSSLFQMSESKLAEQRLRKHYIWPFHE